MFKVKTPDGLKGIGALYVKTGEGTKAEVVSGYQVQRAGGVKTLRPIYTSAVGAPIIADVSCTQLAYNKWEIVVTATPAHAGDVLEYRLVGYSHNGEQVDMETYGEWQTDSRIIFPGDASYCAKDIFVEVRSRRGDKYSEIVQSFDPTGAHSGHPDYYCEPAGYGEHNAICVRCGDVIFHDTCSEAYRDNGDGSHEIYCPACEQTLNGTESCTYGDDGACIHCGGTSH